MSGAADPACAWRISLASTCTIVVAWPLAARSRTVPSASPERTRHAIMRAELKPLNRCLNAEAEPADTLRYVL